MADKAAAKAAARAKFEGVFDTIADELLAYLKGEGMPADAIEWYKKVGTHETAGWSAKYRYLQIKQILRTTLAMTASR